MAGTAEIFDKHFRATGITHQLTVVPNDNQTGWVLFARSFTGEGSANLPQEDAVALAHMLLAGPGDIDYTCARHRTTDDVCLRCLTEPDLESDDNA